MRRTLTLLLVLAVAFALRRSGGGDGGGDGPSNRPGDGGDGTGSGRPSQSHGNINAGQGTGSAQDAVQAEFNQGRSQPADTSTPNDPSTTSKPSDSITFSDKQLNKKFKHAKDFGVEGNNNRANQQKFKEALEAHVDAPGTQRIEGTYRGQDVVHYVDPASGRNVMTDRNGNLLSAWTLNEAQLENVTTRGSL